MGLFQWWVSRLWVCFVCGFESMVGVELVVGVSVVGLVCGFVLVVSLASVGLFHLWVCLVVGLFG